MSDISKLSIWTLKYYVITNMYLLSDKNSKETLNSIQYQSWAGVRIGSCQNFQKFYR